MDEVCILAALQRTPHPNKAVLLGALQERLILVHEGSLFHLASCIHLGIAVCLDPTNVLYSAIAPLPEENATLLEMGLTAPQKEERLRLGNIRNAKITYLIEGPGLEVFVLRVQSHDTSTVFLPWRIH